MVVEHNKSLLLDYQLLCYKWRSNEYLKLKALRPPSTFQVAPTPSRLSTPNWLTSKDSNLNLRLSESRVLPLYERSIISYNSLFLIIQLHLECLAMGLEPRNCYMKCERTTIVLLVYFSESNRSSHFNGALGRIRTYTIIVS